MNGIFLVGAQKCGTTSLANALANSDSSIELCDPKEPMIFSLGDFDCHKSLFVKSNNFFSSSEEKNSQYKVLFNDLGKIKLDASTSYFISPKACIDIKKSNPDAKIIILLRDPIQRLISAYWHYVKSGVICHNFNRAIEFGPTHLINIGFYEQHIKAVKEVFGEDSVFVASDKHMYENPTEFSSELGKFLGITFSSSLIFEKDNTGQYPIFFRLQLLINFAKQNSKMNFHHNKGNDTLYQKYGALGLVLHVISKLNLQRKKPMRIKTNLLDKLIKLYKEENTNIGQYFDFGDSKHFYKTNYALLDEGAD
ncbi:MAG: hypothetical protein ACJA0H_000475 [Francisellaceae bacterium]|jgi:hypothetical protein